MKLFFLPGYATRFGVTLSKKYGKAVERNKVKRQLREIFRNWKETAPIKGDYLFYVFPGFFSYKDRYDQFLRLVERIPSRLEA